MKKFIAFVLIVVLFNNCSESIKLSRAGLREIVPLAGNIKFQFNQDMVSDEHVNIWDTAQYIKFTPPLHGKFKWKNKRELVFSPYHYLRPSTQYTAKFNNNVKGLIVEDDDAVEFHTPFLTIDNFQAYFAKENLKSDNTVIRYDFEFNYKVRPTDLKEKLSIKLNGKDVDYELLSQEVSDKVSVIVSNFDVDTQSAQTEIKIAKGMKILNISMSNTDLSKSTKIVEPDNFKIQNIQAHHDGYEGTITITANQDIVEKNLRHFIEIFPKVPYNMNVEGRKIYLKSKKFDLRKKYTINVKEGLFGTLGGQLDAEYTDDVPFGELEPEIKILDNKAEYLSGKGFKNIELRIVNVPKVKLTIKKVYKNNLISYLNNRSYYRDYYSDYYYDNIRNVGEYGDIVYEKELESKSLPEYNNGKLLNLNFEDKIRDREGVYVVEIRSSEDYWLNARKIVSISDIGLIAKCGKNKLYVFANSIESAKPISKVELELIGKNNQLVATAKTNGNGLAVVDLDKLPAENFAPALIVAKLKKDFNFLPFNRTKVGTSRFDINGKTENAAGYDAFIYGDRDIYRPGETMNIAVILRNEKWQVPDKIPVKLKVFAPNGKIFKTIKKTLDSHGSFETNVIVPKSAPTGNYSIELYTTTDVFLKSKALRVEEFVPDRIKVNVKTDKKDIFAGESVNVQIQANNLFGPPAANRNYEITERIKRKNYYSKNHSDYNFSITGGDNYFKSNIRKGKTNSLGQAVENYKYPASYIDMGILNSDFYITVFDETGRPVNRFARVKIYTQDKFYGINMQDYYNSINREMNIPLIVLDKNDKAVSAQANVKIIKHEYKTVLAKSGSNFRYKSEHEEVVQFNKTMNISGANTFIKFVPKTSGSYEVRIAKPNSKTYVKEEFYAYGWGATSNSSFRVNNEGHIDIQLDKKKYQVGDKAKVILKTPFSGKVLITVEQKDVSKHFYMTTDKRAVSFSLDITDNYVPNIYISATLIKAHQKSDIPLTVAHGYMPVKVENLNNKIPLTITAVEKSNSKTKQKIRIKTKPNTAVTLAVVDEGVLQVTDFQTPDPYKYFYRKRALEVNSYNIYPYLFPEINIKTGKEGGGGFGSLKKRINPMTNKRFKLVSFWSGIKTTDSQGNLEYEIDIPQFSGSLRIMAVAYNGKAFGAKKADMIVADPLIISSALPRFLSPKDEIEMSVTLSNTTKSSMNCQLAVNLSDKLQIIGDNKSQVSIAANSEKQLYYKLKVKPEIGEAKVNIVANVGGKTYSNETDISIRPASPLQKISGSGVIKAGANQKIDIKTGRFMPKSVDSKLLISNSPLVEFSKNLDYLIHYPYGCVEQTVSAVFPQLYYGNLAQNLSTAKKFNVSYNVNEAIRKLQLMQLYNGGLTYWQGTGNESWWGSVYAAHFLVEAQKQGYQVDKTMLDKLFEYLKNKLKHKQTINYWYNGNMKKKIAPREVAYSLYVMALDNRAKTSYMNYYKSRPEQLSIDSKYLLAAAFALKGDMNRYNQILPNSFEGEKSRTAFGGSFHSPIRDEAISLNALLEVDPDNAQIPIMAKHLSEKVKSTKYLSTQETVFAFLAMGKIAKQASKSNISGEVLSNNSKIASYDNKTLVLKTKDLKNGNISISTKGNGNLYYFYEAEGISKDGSYLQEDKYMKVRKSFFSQTGESLQSNVFNQNDLIVVRLSIQGTYNTMIDNVVISDILPAGFEIENPRISSIPGMDWIKDKSYPEYTDIRDDRINIFGSVNNKVRNYYYVVRAVTPGVFQMGPVGADAMYNGEYHSYNGAGVITIKR